MGEDNYFLKASGLLGMDLWLRNQTDKAAPCLEVIIINCVVDSFSSYYIVFPVNLIVDDL